MALKLFDFVDSTETTCYCLVTSNLLRLLVTFKYTMRTNNRLLSVGFRTGRTLPAISSRCVMTGRSTFTRYNCLLKCVELLLRIVCEPDDQGDEQAGDQPGDQPVEL